MLRRLALHVSSYSIGNLLVTISGLVSFPIFTRVFTVSEYGMLNLIAVTLGLLVAVSKLGLQHSIVRYYGEVKAGRSDVTLPQFRATTLFGMMAVGVAATVAWSLISRAIPSAWWADPRTGDLFLVTAVLLLIRTLDSSLVNFLRAEERSGVLNVYNVIKRYGTLALTLLTLFYLARNLYGYFWSMVIAESVALGILFVWMSRSRRFSPREYSPALFRRMLVFGIPMIAFELSAIVLNIGDRYVIQAMLGNEALGVYSASYNFAQYVEGIFFAALTQAITPMYVRIWEEKGPEETATFLNQTLHFYLLGALPMVAGLSATGREMLIILASEKYADGAAIIPYVAGGMAISGSLGIIAAGLYIHKRSLFMASLMAICAVLNVALNIWLIPLLGIAGSAIATLIAYAILTIGAWRASYRLLPISFPWGSAAKFSVLSIIMYLAVTAISLGNPWATVSAQVALGVGLYALLVLAFDGRSRAALRSVGSASTKKSQP